MLQLGFEEQLDAVAKVLCFWRCAVSSVEEARNYVFPVMTRMTYIRLGFRAYINLNTGFYHLSSSI